MQRALDQAEARASTVAFEQERIDNQRIDELEHTLDATRRKLAHAEAELEDERAERRRLEKTKRDESNESVASAARYAAAQQELAVARSEQVHPSHHCASHILPRLQRASATRRAALVGHVAPRAARAQGREARGARRDEGAGGGA